MVRMKKAKRLASLRDYEITCLKTIEVIVTVRASDENNAISRFEDGFIESELDVDVVDFERRGWPKLKDQ